MDKRLTALKMAEEALVKANHFHDYEDELAAIRDALAEPEITTPDVCGEVCARAKLCYGCNKSFDEALAKKAPEWVDVDDYEEPSVSDGVCGGCAKKSADGWALYCIECWEKTEPVKHEVHQEPVGEMIDKNGYKGAAWYCEPPITGTQLYAAPVDAKAILETERKRHAFELSMQEELFADKAEAIRAEERQRCIKAIRKAHDEELCDAYDCIKVIKELE